MLVASRGSPSEGAKALAALIASLEAEAASRRASLPPQLAAAYAAREAEAAREGGDRSGGRGKWQFPPCISMELVDSEAPRPGRPAAGGGAHAGVAAGSRGHSDSRPGPGAHQLQS